MNYYNWQVFSIASLTVHPKGVWFRLFGWGLSFDMDYPVFYSERIGYHKVHRFGRLAVQVLNG